LHDQFHKFSLVVSEFLPSREPVVHIHPFFKQLGPWRSISLDLVLDKDVSLEDLVKIVQIALYSQLEELIVTLHHAKYVDFTDISILVLVIKVKT
jgi:hypothetical protein